MTSPQDGHLTHSPSGTRLGWFFASGSIGLRTFLNQAIEVSLSKTGSGQVQVRGTEARTEPEQAQSAIFVRGT